MVIHSAVQHFQQTLGEKAGRPHIIINNLEHNSVTLTVRNLEEQGKIGEGGRGRGRGGRGGRRVGKEEDKEEKGERRGRWRGEVERKDMRTSCLNVSHPNPLFIFVHTHIFLPLTPSPISLHPSPPHIEVTEVKATPSTGAVSPADITAALRPTTILVSLMLANNETGVIQPVGEVVRVVRGEEGEQKRRIFVHTDAAQVNLKNHISLSSAITCLGRSTVQ